MNIPMVESAGDRHYSRPKGAQLVMVVSISTNDEKEPWLDWYFDHNCFSYNCDKNTARRILGIVPMQDDITVDTWTGAIKYFLRSDDNVMKIHPYGMPELGYIRLNKAGGTFADGAVRACVADEDCVLHEFVSTPSDAVSESVIEIASQYQWRGFWDAFNATDDKRTFDRVSAVTLSDMTEFLKQRLTRGWVIDPDDVVHRGDDRGLPWWSINVIKPDVK